MDAEEDVQDFRLLPPGFDPTHVVMLLLRSERALHRCRPHPRKFPSYKVFLVHFLEGLPPLYEGGLDFQLLAEVSVCRAGIARVPANLFRIHPEKTPVHLDAVRQPGPFIEGVERKLLNERYPIHQDVVALGAELHVLRLLPSHDRPHIRLAHAHDPVRDALAGIAALEVVALLAIRLRDDVQRLLLPGREQLDILMLALHLPHLFQHLPQKIQQAAGDLPGLGLAVLPLLAVRQVCLLDIQELRPRTMDSQLAARLAHQVISLLHALPQQFLVGRIAHLALVAGRIREHRVQILHVRLPRRGKQVLQFLDLQLSGQLRRNVVQQFVVRQRMDRIDEYVTEQLVVDVPVFPSGVK